ncbi:MAG: hypothetical protein WCQ57_10045, partial [Verrucomicrobiota bacterium]
GYKPSLVSVCETFSQLTETGALGSPEKATEEKGMLLFDLLAKALIRFLSEFSTWSQNRR